eukprot:13824655-Heterocapsa_arctica.AAC.1
MKVLTWYSDDDVYHERIVLYGLSSSSTRYVVLTPDKDVYAKELDGTDDEGRALCVLLGAGGGRPAWLDRPVYAFRGV